MKRTISFAFLGLALLFNAGFSPADGTTVSILQPYHKEYDVLFNSTSRQDEIAWEKILSQHNKDEILTTPRSVEFKFDSPVEKMEIADNAGFENSKVVGVNGGMSADVTNLCVNGKYYWRTFDSDGKASESHWFSTEDETPRWISVPGLHNVRDIGNYKSKRFGGKIRQGMFYRGSEFDTHLAIKNEGKDVIVHDLKIKTDLDLRGGKYAKSANYTPVFDNIISRRLFPLTSYADIFANKDNEKAYLEIFSILADSNSYPVYAHCWGGADRTGTLVFLLEAALGVSDEDLLRDYEITNFSIFGSRPRNDSKRYAGFISQLNAFGKSSDSYSIKAENYLLSIGITRDCLQKIRSILLTPAQE